MMGDRDFRSIVENAINSIGKELEIKIDSANIQTIHLHEEVQCLRRSYYDRIDPQEVQRKRHAIFQHQSQKDRPVFPGDDEREFWVRAEERNKENAVHYHELGLANYEAMEAFVRWKF